MPCLWVFHVLRVSVSLWAVHSLCCPSLLLPCVGWGCYCRRKLAGGVRLCFPPCVVRLCWVFVFLFLTCCCLFGFLYLYLVRSCLRALLGRLCGCPQLLFLCLPLFCGCRILAGGWLFGCHFSLVGHGDMPVLSVFLCPSFCRCHALLFSTSPSLLIGFLLCDTL